MAERALEGIRIIECGHLASAAYAAKEYVLREILGYSAEEVAGLRDRQVLT